MLKNLRLNIVAAVFLLVAVPFAAQPGSLQCRNSQVSVDYDDPGDAQAVCEAVARAETLFEGCNIAPLSRPVRVELVGDIKPGCVALYHCDEDNIQVLSPALMQDRREPEGAFSQLSLKDYFASVIVHELTHAANDTMPCPFETCVVADEYIAYAMQIMSLDAQAQLEFEAKSGIGKRISSEELSAVILFMAPHRFAQKTWAHLSQQGDACGYIGSVIRGQTLLDRGRF